MNILLDALKNSILITGLVMIMMLLIEYVNIHSHGESFKKLRKSPFRQVVVAALLGLVPGCVGGFAVVSLYTHNLLSFGSLVAMMISSSGDEAFIMLAMIPKTAIFLFVLLLFTGIGAGLLVDRFIKVKQRPFAAEEFSLHEECCDKNENQPKHDHSHPQIFSGKGVPRKMTKERISIMAGIAVFIIAVVMGLLEHKHIEGEGGHEGHAHEMVAAAPAESHTHADGTVHTGGHHEAESAAQAEIHEHNDVHTAEFDIFSERWINLLFAGVSLFVLILTARANEHFIKRHLWDHVVKKHFRSIFLWTFGALLVIHFGMQYLDIQHWIKENVIIMILIAVAIGIIPESGPHMVFITLFAGGMIPFSVLLASSIAQDGHTALPLLAESKKSFVLAKAINIVIGFVIGFGVHLAGF